MKKFIEFLLIVFPLLFSFFLFYIIFHYDLDPLDDFNAIWILILGFSIGFIISSCISYILSRKVLPMLWFMSLYTCIHVIVSELLLYYSPEAKEISASIPPFILGTMFLVVLKFNPNFIKILSGDKPFKHNGKLYRLTDLGWRRHTIDFALLCYLYGIFRPIFKYYLPNSIKIYLFIGIFPVLCIYYYYCKSNLNNPLYTYPDTEPEPSDNNKP